MLGLSEFTCPTELWDKKNTPAPRKHGFASMTHGDAKRFRRPDAQTNMIHGDHRGRSDCCERGKKEKGQQVCKLYQPLSDNNLLPLGRLLTAHDFFTARLETGNMDR